MISIPDEIARIVNDRPYTVESIGQSGAEVRIFDDMVLKIEPQDGHFDSTVALMRWLDGRLPAPRVLCAVKENGMQYLLMSRVEGMMLCDEAVMADMEAAVTLYAESLKMLWRTDITGCPVTRSLDAHLAEARCRMEKGLVDMDECEPDTFGPDGFESPEALLMWLEQNRPEPEIALTHGDLCMPNVFVKNEKISGYIDIGNMGVGDRWFDIALCWRSLKHNCTGKYARKNLGDHTDMLFEKLGIAPDWQKIRYYVLLDDFF